MTILANPASAARAASRSRSERSLRRLFFILAFAAAGMAALLALLPAAGHDQLWFLLMARRWLGGATIYGPLLFDSNPPGIVWLSALPVLLGNLLHLPATTAAKLLVALAETAAALLGYRFLRRAWRQPAAYEVPALLFAAIVLFAVVPARDFGQRDQMLAFLILPYVLAAAVDVRAAGLTLSRCLAGIMAAVGICLKPHHALIPISIELALLLSPISERRDTETETRRDSLPLRRARLRTLFRPEPILILLIGLAFLAAIHRLTPLYFSFALPIVRETYWAIGHLSLAGLAFQAIELCILAALVFGLYIARQPRSPAVRLLVVAGSAAAIAYLIQGTGWYYQQLPAIDLFGAALALLLLDIAHQRLAQPEHLAVPRWLVPAVATLSLLALGLTTWFTGCPFTPDRAFDLTSPDPAFFTALAPGTPVAILTTSVDEALMPIARYHLTWAQRTDNLWLLPAILRSETLSPPGQSPAGAARPGHVLAPPQLAALEALQHRWMLEDLDRWRPRLVLVERCQKPAVHCQELEDRDDDLLAWFLRDPGFAALWRSYAYVGSRGRFDAYTLMRP